MWSPRERVSWSVDETDPQRWARIGFVADTSASPSQPAADLTTAFAAAMTRGLLIASFTVSGLDATLRRWLTENHGDQMPYASRLLSSPALAAVPELSEPAHMQPTPTPAFAWMAPIYLAASLTEMLSAGGAYGRGPSVAASRDLCDQFVASIIDRC